VAVDLQRHHRLAALQRMQRRDALGELLARGRHVAGSPSSDAWRARSSVSRSSVISATIARSAS
jgi:hypothetical protein